MRKILILSALIIAMCSCSKSDQQTQEKQDKLQGNWALTQYTEYDPTGGTTNFDDWLIETITFNGSTVMLTKGEDRYKGSYALTDDSISITVDGHPEMEMSGEVDLPFNNSHRLRISNRVKGFMKKSWIFTLIVAND